MANPPLQPKLGIVLLFALAIGWVAAASAAATPAGGNRIWTQRIPKAGYPYGLAVSPDSSKVFITGEYGTTAGYDAAMGTKLWSIDESGATLTGVAVSPDSATVYVAGYLSQNSLVVAYDAATGTQVWKDVNGEGGAHVAVSPDGSVVFVTGSAHGDFDTQALAADTGATLWVSLYEFGSGISLARDLVVSPDGSAVFVVGSSPGPGDTYNDYATVAYATSDGAQLWASRYNSSGHRGDTPEAIGISPDGGTVFVTGCSGQIDYCYTYSDFVTIAYDASNEDQRWLARFDGAGHGDDGATDLAVSPDGTLVYVAGWSTGKLSIDDAVVAYDAATGTVAWQDTYRGVGNENDYPCCIAATPDGSSVVITGNTAVDWATVSFDAHTGKQRWAAIYDGPAHSIDSAFALAVSPDSSMVFVAGSSIKNPLCCQYDFTTIAYGA